MALKMLYALAGIAGFQAFQHQFYFKIPIITIYGYSNQVVIYFGFAVSLWIIADLRIRFMK